MKYQVSIETDFEPKNNDELMTMFLVGIANQLTFVDSHIADIHLELDNRQDKKESTSVRVTHSSDSQPTIVCDSKQRTAYATQLLAKRLNIQSKIDRAHEKIKHIQFSHSVDKLMLEVQDSVAIMQKKGLYKSDTVKVSVKPRLDKAMATIRRIEAGIVKNEIPVRQPAYNPKQFRSIPTCDSSGQIIQGANAGFRWDEKQQGWIGVRPIC